MDLTPVIIAASIPSALTAFLFWLLEKKIEKRENEKEKRDEARKQLELTLVQSVNAALALSEATAKAVQRIPDAHCNGDIQVALEYADRVKHDQRDFLQKQGIDNIF
jgi:hypothetical protein